jgi:hypothetical protein
MEPVSSLTKYEQLSQKKISNLFDGSRHSRAAGMMTPFLINKAAHPERAAVEGFNAQSSPKTSLAIACL